MPFRRLLMLLSSAAALLSLPSHARASANFAGPVSATMVKVLDGDSFSAQAHVWPGTIVAVSIRIRGVDAPEMRSRCENERQLAKGSKKSLELVLASSKQLKITNVSGDKYFGRVLADVILADGSDLGQVLLVEGSVRPYAGRSRNSWCVVRGGR